MLAQVSHFCTHLWLHDSNEIVSNAIHNCQETVHCKALHSWNNCQRTLKVIGNGAIQDCWYGLTVLDYCNYDSLLILHTWQTVTFTSPSTYNHTLTDNHTQLNRWYILQDIVLLKAFNTGSQNDLQGHSRSWKSWQASIKHIQFHISRPL